jgi:hypothetical protein
VRLGGAGWEGNGPETLLEPRYNETKMLDWGIDGIEPEAQSGAQASAGLPDEVN